MTILPCNLQVNLTRCTSDLIASKASKELTAVLGADNKMSVFVVQNMKESSPAGALLMIDDFARSV